MPKEFRQSDVTKNKGMKKYKILYVDPPYLYKNFTEKKQGSPKKHYSGLTVNELCNLPVQNIADKNCVLFLWCPGTKIMDGDHIKIMSAWGFRPVTFAFVWKKTYKNGNPYCGIGFYSRQDCEFCLLGIKGRLKRQSAKVRQSIVAPMKRPHSSKPPEVRNKIVELFGDLPKIELFARPPIPSNWTATGLEYDKTDIHDFLRAQKC